MYFNREDNPNDLTIEEAGERTCPYGVSVHGKCLADRCMAWTVTADGFQRESTTNIQRGENGEEMASGEPPRPSGQGWEAVGEPTECSYHRRAKDSKPYGKRQEWRRKVGPHKGQCRRHEGGCY